MSVTAKNRPMCSTVRYEHEDACYSTVNKPPACYTQTHIPLECPFLNIIVNKYFFFFNKTRIDTFADSL